MSARPPLTHFLCIPLINNASRPQFEKSLRQFKADLSSHSAVARFTDSRAVRPIGSIHLTIGVMSLTSPDRLRAAVDYLSSLDITGTLRHAALETRTENGLRRTSPQSQDASRESLCIRLSVRGLEARAPADRTSVVWIPVHHPVLLRFCVRLRMLFQDAGYMLPETRPLKLHATLLNTVYARGRNNGGRSGLPLIDARQIVEQMGNRVWAEDIKLDRVAICEMGAQAIKDRAEQNVDEAYKEVVAKALPTS